MLPRLIGTLQVVTVVFLLWRGRFDLLGVLLATHWAVVIPYVKRGGRLFWTALCAMIGFAGWTLQTLLGSS